MPSLSLRSLNASKLDNIPSREWYEWRTADYDDSTKRSFAGMPRPNRLEARQLWGPVITPTNLATATAAECTPFELPKGGGLVFNDSYTSVLTENLKFQQPCDNGINSDPGSTGNSTVVGLMDPFYASTSPQIYAIATATVISYLLVILIFITPRTFFVGGPGGGAGFLSRRGMIGGSSGNSSIIGVGQRPWLQKIATVSVAISLTIATADTFRVAADQYYKGYTDAGLLVDQVVGSLEIKIVRVISDTFLWLAQVQTLIRLFPRHKEKVTIKWLGFVLVLFDTVFSILNDFVDQSTQTKPRSFKDAIPALSYLFELAIGLIYASCVIYYALSKRRFAFWHPKMRNICLVALLSLIAVLIPIVFFIVDVSKPNVAGWGDYIRWVGAAAASVVVWEWVERIEALERDERKDGILGREIFDGDEMLDATPSEEADWPGRREYWNQHGFPTDDPDSEGGTGLRARRRTTRSRVPFGMKKRDIPTPRPRGEPQSQISSPREASAMPAPAIPPQVATPVSRSDNTSAASTVYAVRYHTLGAPTPPIVEEMSNGQPGHRDAILANNFSNVTPSVNEEPKTELSIRERDTTHGDTTIEGPIEDIEHTSVWYTVPNPFKRRRSSPPAEVAGAQTASGTARRSPFDRGLNLRNRVGVFTSSQKDRLNRGKDPDPTAPMAVTVIPARRRGNRTWSPGEGGDEEPESYCLSEGHEDSTDTVDNEEHTNPDRATLSTNDMPVTVIPAPRRGQRAWSPQDQEYGGVSKTSEDPREVIAQNELHKPGSTTASTSEPSRNCSMSARGPLRRVEWHLEDEYSHSRMGQSLRHSPYAGYPPLSISTALPIPVRRAVITSMPLHDVSEYGENSASKPSTGSDGVQRTER